jgi:23S rRNA (guanosine2251-2'-O)-methyltransferase
MIILKGKRAVKEALLSNNALERIIVSHKSQYSFDIKELVKEATAQQIKVQVLNEKEFAQLLPNETNTQGIVAYIQDIKNIGLKELINNKEKYPFVVAVDHLQDPYNFGAILRTCEILGIAAVIYPKDRNCPITPGVIKASSGAINHLDMIKVTNLAQSLKSLDDNGYWLFGADANNGVSLEDISVQAPLVLVVGNEQKGISPRIQKMLHSSIIIPTSGKTDSLNVSVATGIITYSLAQKLKGQ